MGKTMRSRWAALLSTVLVVGTVSAEPYRFDATGDFLAPADAWQPWRDLIARNLADLELISTCADEAAACPPKLQALRHLLDRAAALSEDDRVRAVNAYVNRRRYRDDRSQHGPDGTLPNEWQTLIEFLSHGGDCEDFAVAKYFLLRQLDLPADRLRVVIARERAGRAYHALLAYRAADSVWLVETDGSIYRRGRHHDYQFLFSLSEDGIWDHAPQKGNSIKPGRPS